MSSINVSFYAFKVKLRMTLDHPGSRPPQTLPQFLAHCAEKHQDKVALKRKNPETGKWEVMTF